MEAVAIKGSCSAFSKSWSRSGTICSPSVLCLIGVGAIAFRVGMGAIMKASVAGDLQFKDVVHFTAEPWPKPDLFFLDNALRHGMSVEEVAGFLGKGADEVREKANLLGLDGWA